MIFSSDMTGPGARAFFAALRAEQIVLVNKDGVYLLSPWDRSLIDAETPELRLTTYADYTLRVLMYVSPKYGEKATMKGICESYGISRNHVIKIVQDLAREGVLETSRGKTGGVLLARPAEDNSLRKVIQSSEPDFRIDGCFECGLSTCPLVGNCVLTGVLAEAMNAFLDVLGKYTLADLVRPKNVLARMLNLPEV
jgi:Rrf2 family transcriptional regulator, nitric oxide-sensitive transcriptional repressor